MRRETENDLIQSARAAISSCNWEVGRLASLWTEKYARGRTDADFAAMIGLTREHIAQRREVWNQFGDQKDQRPALSWSHYRAAVAWDDAAASLDWAQNTGATRDEMVKYHASLSGSGSDEDATDGEPAAVTEPDKRRRKRKSQVESTEAQSEGEAEQGPQVIEPAVSAPALPEGPVANPSAPARVVTIGQILADLREWAGVAGNHHKARIAEEVALAALGLVEITARDAMPIVVALLGELTRKLPEEQMAEVATVLRAWADQFASAGGLVLTGDAEQQSLPGAISAHQQVMQEWNMLGAPFRPIIGLTDKRRRTLTQRLKSRVWRDSWQKALEIVKETDWTRGKNDRQWVATFDWFIRPDTVVRLMEAGVEKKGQSARASAFDLVFGAPPLE
jgi:hypothetical protein